MWTGLLVPPKLQGVEFEADYQQRECVQCGKIEEERL
jgi:hypothetical protein